MNVRHADGERRESLIGRDQEMQSNSSDAVSVLPFVPLINSGVTRNFP